MKFLGGIQTLLIRAGKQRGAVCQTHPQHRFDAAVRRHGNISAEFIRCGMDISDVSRTVPDGMEVDIMVSPRSGRSGPDGFDEWRKRLIVRVKAPPLDGKANREAEEIFRSITGCACEIRRGHLNRHKTVAIHGDPSEICEKLRSGV